MSAAPPAYDILAYGPSLHPLLEKSPSSTPFPTAPMTVPSPGNTSEDAEDALGSDDAPPSYEVAVCEHSPNPLAPTARALKIGICVANPALGLALALCPSRRERVCKSCGDSVVVPIKKFFA